MHRPHVEQWWALSGLGAFALISAFASNNCVRVLPRTQHLRHHLSGDSKSRSGIKASVRPISSSSPTSNRDMGGKTKPGSRVTHTKRDEKIINVRVYETSRCIVKMKGWCIIFKWKPTRTYSQDGWGTNNRIMVTIGGSLKVIFKKIFKNKRTTQCKIIVPMFLRCVRIAMGNSIEDRCNWTHFYRSCTSHADTIKMNGSKSSWNRRNMLCAVSVTTASHQSPREFNIDHVTIVLTNNNVTDSDRAARAPENSESYSETALIDDWKK